SSRATARRRQEARPPSWRRTLTQIFVPRYRSGSRAPRDARGPMRNTPLPVAVWSAGGIGSIAIRAIQRRPDLELVGVWVHTPEKVGRDAGELTGAARPGSPPRTTPAR